MRGRGRGGRGFSGGSGSSFTAFMRENKEVNEDAEVIESEDVLTLYPPMTVALPTLPNEKESFCLQAGDIFSQR